MGKAGFATTLFLLTKLRYRKNIRLTGFDYSSIGYYFVTICTKEGRKLFVPRLSKKYGYELNVAATHASPYVLIDESRQITDTTEQCLLAIPEHFPQTEVDFYVFMPTHLHLILTTHADDNKKVVQGGVYPAATEKPSLWVIVGSFKSAASRLTRRSLWQPNYYEHIIRDEESLDRIRSYILQNPAVEYADLNWKKLDCL